MTGERKRHTAAVLSLDFAEQYGFYLKYHAHPVNQLVHVVFVPLLLGSALAALAQWRVSLGGVKLDLGLIVAVAYALYYIVLSPLLGASAALVMVLPLYLAGRALLLRAPDAQVVWSAFLVIQLLGWSAQFAAHEWLEKRRPALLDNLIQAFASAPLFVFVEVLAFLGLDQGLRKRFQRPQRARSTSRERRTPGGAKTPRRRMAHA
ncbi:hypothetical protein, conserved [Cyanidioschyzon merolae strain 10D]|jgi:uncharacterized membrane protein YGL010W|uniref:DUF962 domain-containing protein n=1 Tax=Cyanidioschyzon merolae (strain NIES-3377 / 10D) TaxID=280699 RepID=M1V5T0_CYAM1|nr:hypothetical protein, conserved [Cyanidioschyzon merolae strain 10D]BAM81205.1 hypothetical protein, conserved [Cyanidioschyzon merolae strain 10D]|eukprot:XP_005537241.1 hypothetical protein, conserved [Cyanidioschyzon merolae strain 10D]